MTISIDLPKKKSQERRKILKPSILKFAIIKNKKSNKVLVSENHIN